MGFFSKLFGLDKKEESKDIGQEVIIETQPITVRAFIEDICPFCKEPIGTERWKKIGGRFVHKKCFKKQAREIFNGNY